MSSSGKNVPRREWNDTKFIGKIIILPLVSIAIILLLWRSCCPSSSPLTMADILIIEPVGSVGAKQIVQRISCDIARIQWSKEGKLRDTILHYSRQENEQQEVIRILSNADRMPADLVQRGLKTIVWRSAVIEIDTVYKSWSLITVGALPFHEGLIEADETNMLRRNPKLNAWFFLPPLQQDSLAVTDILIKLLRDEGVHVKREILR